MVLWIMQPDGRLDAVKGDRHSVGYRRTPLDAEFGNQPVPLQPGQRFYLFTDGILDQNGGERGIAFGRSRLAEALLVWRDRPLRLLADDLSGLLSAYRSTFAQRDDIALIPFLLDRAPPSHRSHP